MVRLVSRPLEVQVRFVEVLVRVTGAVSLLPDRVRVRDQVVASVTRLDLMAVRVEAALLLRVRREAEAEVEAVVHHRQDLRVMEAGIYPRRIRRPVVVPVEVAVALVEVLRVARRPRLDRQARLMTLRMFRLGSGSRTLRVNEVR